MQLNQRILSDLIVHMKYARHLPGLQRRELWPEICDRYARMLVDRYPHMEGEIYRNLSFVLDKKNPAFHAGDAVRGASYREKQQQDL